MVLPTFSGFVFMALLIVGAVYPLILAPLFFVRGIKANRSHTELVNTLRTLGVSRVQAHFSWSLADPNPEDTPQMAAAKEVARKDFARFRQLSRQMGIVSGACFAGSAVVMLLDALGVAPMVIQR